MTDKVNENTWRTIDSAPLDGSHMWLYDGEEVVIGCGREACPALELDAVFLARARESSGWFVSVCYRTHPTHWMPLPEPPQ